MERTRKSRDRVFRLPRSGGLVSERLAMPSWQARVVDRFVRVVIRRRDWGDAPALARRARRLLGAPRAYQRFVLRGIRCNRVTDGGVRGEWLAVPEPGLGVILYVHGG